MKSASSLMFLKYPNQQFPDSDFFSKNRNQQFFDSENKKKAEPPVI
jgi:hypothetical protein